MSTGSAPAALGQIGESTLVTPPAATKRRSSSRPKAWRVTIYVICLIIFLLPLVAAFKYALIEKSGALGLGNFTEIVRNAAIRKSVILSLELALITAGFCTILLVPTAVLVRLKLPKLAIMMDAITLLPFVVPPIVIADGLVALQRGAPLWLVNLLYNHPLTLLPPVYVVLAVPLYYRLLDIGLKSIDLHTLVDASRSLGHGWISTLARVVVPNIQTAVLGGIFLTMSLVLGEVVIANEFTFNTLQVQMIETANQLNSVGIPVALSLLVLAFTFMLLFMLTILARRRGQSLRTTR
jgi:putative spermidine/putrescine transport system permease protein